jgi:hypothetical protein
MDGGGNTHEFVMDDTHAESAGYLAATQTPDGVVHLISSRLHYRFNLAWLEELPKVTTSSANTNGGFENRTKPTGPAGSGGSTPGGPRSGRGPRP